MFKTIEDSANCDIRSVIRFLNVWKNTVFCIADKAKVQTDHSRTQNHVFRFLGQKMCHIGVLRTQKQNRKCRCLRCNTEKATTRLSK